MNAKVCFKSLSPVSQESDACIKCFGNHIDNVPIQYKKQENMFREQLYH